ncbi:nucleobindin-2-like [Centruroides vittatus]|uniref:nucleobindin-2-like n=1 Tax=Centruroides vittatus TaxID=120091 RepID=UPI00351066F2
MKFNDGIPLIVLIYMTKFSLSAPVDSKKQNPYDIIDDFNLEYNNYMKEVAKILEEDEDFLKEVKKIVHTNDFEPEDTSYALQFAKHNVRTKLDELKRLEIDRFRKYAARQMELNDPAKGRPFKYPTHLDLRNPHTFEVEDLKRLMQTLRKDMEKISEKRKEQFKQYELEKERNYRERLKQLNETERKKAEIQHEEMIKKHKDHPKIHEPGSKPQLEEVWREEDDLPEDEFNPETFFDLRDLNGDQHLDTEEVEAFVIREIRKMYDSNNEEDDPVERREELTRMSEYIFKEADKDNDYLISKKEFLEMTRRKEFEKDEGWRGLDEELPFTEEELAEYEKLLEKKKKEVSGNKI